MKIVIVRFKRILSLNDPFLVSDRLRETYKVLHAPCTTLKGEKLVSIVIPARNEKTRIAVLLDSLNASCYRPIEVIVAPKKSYGYNQCK